ncbi:MAG TPA: choice-of-anchor D domain-containing protein [Candidatus Acidoferrum sp.]|nr:choice-of-anchor D domain-containing protein [Candidatus Acidoferrum sp.]
MIIILAAAGCASYTPSHSAPSQPAIALSATSFNFNSVAVGQVVTKTLHIANTGGAPLTLQSVTLKSSQFAFSGPSAPRTILPNQNLDYTLIFQPSLAGSATASIQFASNASSVPASVSLAGVAEKSLAAIQVTPASISFGNLNVQSTATQNVTLKNTGDVTIVISGIAVSGAGFGYSSLAPGYSLAPNQSVTFQIWFRPQAGGSASGHISIISSSLPAPASITVSGAGVTSSPPAQNPLPHSVALSWNPSDSSVIGYRVYRDDGSGYSPISAVISDLSYTDSDVISGSTYTYVVTAVDAAGDESVYSNIATAVVPFP